MPHITAICLATGRISQLQESIASFAGQDHPDAELWVVNTRLSHTLAYDDPRVRFFNPKTQFLPAVAKNWAIEQSAGEVIIAWDECSVYLPGFLSQIAAAIEGREWACLSHEFCLENGEILNLVPASEYSFAFTRQAWAACGAYQPGIKGASDRNLIGRITRQHPGQNTEVALENINLLRLGSAQERERSQPMNVSGLLRLVPALARDYGALILSARTGTRENRLCVVQLGRYGDIISILPLVKRIHDLYETPHLMVSAKFADLLDGISYCKPLVTQLSNEKLGQAIAIAKQEFQTVVNCGVWGEGFQQKQVTSSYCKDAWNNAGFMRLWDDKSLKPEFDQRDKEREAGVIAKLVGENPDNKPIICINVKDSISSPCPKCLSVIEGINAMWREQAIIVDLAGFKAHRIYDLLGLFEISKCLVCIDSAYVHLAQATEIGIIIIKNPKPWAGTIVRRNLAAETDYNRLDMQVIHEGIAQCLACVKQPPDITWKSAMVRR